MKRETIITFLEMKKPPTRRASRPPGTALMRAHKPPVHFYRYLYDTVGRPYFWTTRKRMDDEALCAIIHNERVEIFVLHEGGVPAGFCELDRRTPGEADIAFLGLVPDYIGRGLGRFLLSEMIRIAWTEPITRLSVQTCTLDHPAALPLYQRCGFSPYAQKKEIIEV